MHYKNSLARFAMCTSMISSYGHKHWRNTNKTVLPFLRPSEKPVYTAIGQNLTSLPPDYVSSAISSWGQVSNPTPAKLTELHLGHNQQLATNVRDSWSSPDTSPPSYWHLPNTRAYSHHLPPRNVTRYSPHGLQITRRCLSTSNA